MSKRILFVCLGNICRSPSAEAVARVKAAAMHLDYAFDSAGTAGWHIGKPPYMPMQAAALQRGYPLSSLRARAVTRADFDRCDMIVGMDDDNMRDLKAMAHKGGARLARLTDYDPERRATHVPDPYYTRDFDGALDLIERCTDALLQAEAARDRG